MEVFPSLQKGVGSSLALFSTIISLSSFTLIPSYSPPESILMKSCQTGGVAKICQQHSSLDVVFSKDRKHYETYWDRGGDGMRWNLAVVFSSSFSECRLILDFALILHCFGVYVCINTASSKMGVCTSSR